YLMTRIHVVGRDLALAASGIHTRAVDRESKPEPQGHALLVADLGRPHLVDFQRRREGHERRRLVDILVFGASRQENERDQEGPTSHVVYFAAAAAGCFDVEGVEPGVWVSASRSVIFRSSNCVSVTPLRSPVRAAWYSFNAAALSPLA